MRSFGVLLKVSRGVLVQSLHSDRGIESQEPEPPKPLSDNPEAESQGREVQDVCFGLVGSTLRPLCSEYACVHV